MSLDVALTLRYAREGDTKMLEDTASGLGKVESAAQKASAPVKDMAEGLKQTGEAAPVAATEVDRLGEAVQQAGGQFGNLKTLGIAAIGGIAGAIAVAGLDVAFQAALGAATEYFDALTNSPANIADDLEAHEALIRDIKNLWEQANGAASNYGLTTATGLRFEAQQNINRLTEDLESRLGNSQTFNQTLNVQGIFGASLGARAPFEDAIARFRQDLRDGRADVIAFREEVATIAEGLDLGTEGRTFAETIMTETQASAELQSELQRAVDVYKALTGDAQAAATAMGASSEAMVATNTAAAAGLPFLREYQALLDSIGATPASAGLAAGGAGGARAFATGGYTGHGPADQVAGFVHGQEYVFDAASTAAIGVGNLDAIRRGVRGYASGGSVGGGPVAGGGSATAARDWFGLADDLRSARGAIRDFADELWQARSPIEALASVVKSASQSYLNRALGAAGDMLEELIFGALPQHALGTPASMGGWAIAGEHGPELVRLPRGAQVYSHRDSVDLMGSGRGGTINNFYVETPNPRAFAESRSSVARTAARISSAAQRHV